MTLTELMLARNAERWAALTDAERKRIVERRAYHFAVYAQASGFRIANPPKQPPAGRESWGALDNIPSPEWEAVTR